MLSVWFLLPCALAASSAWLDDDKVVILADQSLVAEAWSVSAGAVVAKWPVPESTRLFHTPHGVMVASADRIGRLAAEGVVWMETPLSGAYYVGGDRTRDFWAYGSYKQHSLAMVWQGRMVTLLERRRDMVTAAAVTGDLVTLREENSISDCNLVVFDLSGPKPHKRQEAEPKDEQMRLQCPGLFSASLTEVLISTSAQLTEASTKEALLNPLQLDRPLKGMDEPSILSKYAHDTVHGQSGGPYFTYGDKTVFRVDEPGTQWVWSSGELPVHYLADVSLLLSPSGRHLALVSPAAVFVLDSGDGRLLETLDTTRVDEPPSDGLPGKKGRRKGRKNSEE